MIPVRRSRSSYAWGIVLKAECDEWAINANERQPPQAAARPSHPPSLLLLYKLRDVGFLVPSK